MMSSVVCLYGVWLRFCGAHDVCVQCLLAWVTPVREYVECIYDFFLSSSDNENSILYISLELRNIVCPQVWADRFISCFSFACFLRCVVSHYEEMMRVGVCNEEIDKANKGTWWMPRL